MTLFIENARLVDACRDESGHCLIEHGMIRDCGPDISCPDGVKRFDAQGLVLMPSLLDPHVHFNDPGRADWEGVETGSTALAAGGGTLFFDMPLNCSPVTITNDGLRKKVCSLTGRSHTDFGLWGGIIPGNASEWAPMIREGAVGLKAFMCNSGLDEFPSASSKTLEEAMNVASEYQAIVAVHAELDNRTLSAEEVGGTDAAAWLKSRPVDAEMEAVQLAIELCRKTGSQLHIVHVSAGSVMDEIFAAVKEGLPITAETCAHYLCFTEKDVLEQGAPAKCTPPLRSLSEQTKLWDHVHKGTVSWVCSDHSPAPPEMKTDDDFFGIWGGISGVQHTLSAMIRQGYGEGRLTLSQVSYLCSAGMADRFGLARKGRLQEGCDADLVLLDPDPVITVDAHDLEYRYPVTPYLGKQLQGRIDRVWLRGELLWHNGHICQPPQGEWLKVERGRT